MYCKLVDQKLQTYKGFQWEIGKWVETSGEDDLCTAGWLHCYNHPLLAVLLNCAVYGIKNPQLFEIEVSGKMKTNDGLQFGFTKMKLVKQIPLPEVTDAQRIAFGKLCVRKVNNKYHNLPSYTIAYGFAMNGIVRGAAIIAAHIDTDLNLIEIAEKVIKEN